MRIEQFDGKSDPGSLAACLEIVLAAQRIDDPAMPPETPESFAGQWAHGWDGEPRESWLAYSDDGEPVGCYLLTLPERANTAMAFCSPVVTPASRRAGLGTAILEHCAGRAARAGRSRLAAHVRDGSAGATFAAAKGARGGIDEILRVMDIDASLPARLAGLRPEAEQGAAGYELLSWPAPTPEEYLAPVAQVHTAMADAPRDEGVEHSNWDADRIRTVESLLVSQGMRGYSVAARHTGTGEMAALTSMAVDPGTPDWAYQQLTAVVPAHRGHRLGLLVKIGMLDLLTSHEPGVRHILTGNAGANSYMIAINEQLGFHISGVYRHWELDLAARRQC